MKNTCPICETVQEKMLAGGRCIECKTPLVAIERKDEEGNSFREYIIRKGEKEKIVKEEEKFEIIFNQDGVKVEKSNLNNYIVTFTARTHFSWIYCPSCQAKLFQNDTLKGSMAEKCRKCKAIINYIFN